MSLGNSFGDSFVRGPLFADTGVLRKAAGVAAYLLLGALTLSPLLWATVPALVDYPDHLARMWILLHPEDVPALANNYVVDWRLLPNLAIDLIGTGLARVVPLEAAGRVFIGLTMADLVFATMALHRVLYGRVGLWPLCSLLFVYNAALFLGLLNFLFALGLALLVFSAWLASARWRMSRRVVVFALPAVLLLVLHLFGFGIYGLLVASHELGTWWNERPRQPEGIARRLPTLVQFVPAMLLWLVSMRGGGPVFAHYGDLAAKLFAVAAPWNFGIVPAPLDAVMLLATLVFLLCALRAGALALSPAMRLPIVTMLILAVAMPNWLSGSWAADLRLPVALPFVVIASMRFTARRAPAALAAAAALVLLGLRVWAVSASWHDADRHFAEFRAAARRIPEGARLLVVQAPLAGENARIEAVPASLATRQNATYNHMAELAVIDRAAFIPYLFTGWTPVRPNPRNDAISSQGVPPTPAEALASASPGRPAVPNMWGELPHWRDWPETFDFVLWIDFAQAPPVLAERLEPWASGSFFRIYRVIRP